MTTDSEADPFTVRTDHSALATFKTKQIYTNLKLERMREDLQEYDCTVQYVKGEDLIEADAISRIYEEPILPLKNPAETSLREKMRNIFGN